MSPVEGELDRLEIEGFCTDVNVDLVKTKKCVGFNKNKRCPTNFD